MHAVEKLARGDNRDEEFFLPSLFGMTLQVETPTLVLDQDGWYRSRRPRVSDLHTRQFCPRRSEVVGKLPGFVWGEMG